MFGLIRILSDLRLDKEELFPVPSVNTLIGNNIFVHRFPNLETQSQERGQLDSS